MNKKIKEILTPVLSEQTLYQLTQMKNFVDASIKNSCATNFENDTEKIVYLLNVLQNISDFVSTQTIENKLRIKLINEIEKIELEESLGNDIEPLSQNRSKSPEERPVENQKL